MSKSQCREFWKSKCNEVLDGNTPHSYATKDLSMISVMTDKIKEYMDGNSSILELGCNAGANLNYLSKNGFKNLYGIEINKNAIIEMKQSFPFLSPVIYKDSIENILPLIESNGYDLVFSMAVLLHIHPRSNFIFDEIARISKKYICTVEAEACHSSYIFERNYKRVFEKRGYKEMDFIPVMPNKDYCLRLFEKGG